jgi:hypothetical protein
MWGDPMPAGNGRVPHIPAWLRVGVLVLTVIGGLLFWGTRPDGLSSCLCYVVDSSPTAGYASSTEGLVFDELRR